MKAATFNIEFKVAACEANPYGESIVFQSCMDAHDWMPAGSMEYDLFPCKTIFHRDDVQ